MNITAIIKRKPGRQPGQLSGPRNGSKISLERRAELLSEMRDGATCRETAEKFGISYQRVSQICQMAGVRPQWTHRKKDESEVIKMYQSGKSLKECAEVRNVTYKTIWRILRHNGVELRQTSRSGTKNALYRGGLHYCTKAIKKANYAMRTGTIIRQPCGTARIFRLWLNQKQPI